MRNRSTGRYLVGDKAIVSLGAALAYAGDLASRRTEPGTVYVRVPGEPLAVGRADLVASGVVRITERSAAAQTYARA